MTDLDSPASFGARDGRETAADRSEARVADATAELLAQYREQRVEGVIAAMYRGANDVKRRQLSTALSKLGRDGGLTSEQRGAVETLTDSLVAHLLAPPTLSLREAAAADDWETVETAIELFEPQFDLSNAVTELDYDGTTDTH